MKLFKECRIPALLFLIGILSICPTAFAIGQDRYVQDVAGEGCFPIVESGKASGICADPDDWPGVIRAAGDLQSDIVRVTGVKPAIVTDSNDLSGNAIIIGTLGKSRTVDALVKAGKIDVSRIFGQWEGYGDNLG